MIFPQKIRAPGFGIKLRDFLVESFFIHARFAGDAGENAVSAIQSCPAPTPTDAACRACAWRDWQTHSECRPSPGVIVRFFLKRAGPEAGAPRQIHKFRQRKAGLLDAAQKFHGRFLCHQNNVVLPAEKLRQVFQVARELRLRLRGIEFFPFGDAAFGEGLKIKTLGVRPLDCE
jgi:hypothetical protein